ncbi:MAG: hypothetical protein ACE5F8_03600, partial [Woeseiaceae bacterium]
MPKKSRNKNHTHFLTLPTLLILLVYTPTAFADAYGEARAELVAAYQAEDFTAMRAAAERSLEARPGYAGALFNLALAHVLNGDEYRAMDTLYALLDQKVDFGVKDIDEFEPLRRMPDWAPYSEKVSKLYEPVGDAMVAVSYAQGDFVPEGIALGDDGELFLGSIRHGDILRIGETTKTLVTAEQGGHWSVFGMRYDGKGALWYVSAAIDEFADRDAGDAGRNGLFAVDTASGSMLVKAHLPQTGNKQVLGDLILVDDDTILVADQADGVVYRYTISTEEFSTVIERGRIASPQGLVLDASGDYLYVADYTGGLFRAHIESGEVDRVRSPDSVSDYGIDGLYRYGNRLIAIQNGIRPNRVVELELSVAGDEIVGSRIVAMNLPQFDDPNLGQIVGDEFLFIANS